MKQLYIECKTGVAGDMLLAALMEACGDPADVVDQLNGLGLPQVRVSCEKTQSYGIGGTRLHVVIGGHEEDDADADGGLHHHHHGMGLPDIARLLSGLPVSAWVREHALAVYRSIAEAEAAVHGAPVEQVHFHELGMLDAVVDIVGCCLCVERLSPARICASTVYVGGGTVRCAHGELPVPAPATARLLLGVPSAGGPVACELCTPTGAALIRHFAKEFGGLPEMCVTAVGYGIGGRDVGQPNCVRVFYGTGTQDVGPNDRIVRLECNLDDMTGEAMGFALDALLAAGALDAFYAPIFMKKGRPAQLLTVLCKPERADTLAECMLLHTTTFGVRRSAHERYALTRSFSTAETPWGEVRVKTGTGYGVTKTKPEYEDAAGLAREADVPLSAVLQSVK